MLKFYKKTTLMELIPSKLHFEERISTISFQLFIIIIFDKNNILCKSELILSLKILSHLKVINGHEVPFKSIHSTFR